MKLGVVNYFGIPPLTRTNVSVCYGQVSQYQSYYCLSGNPNRPCFVLKFKQTTVMLDCGLDVTPMLNFLPLPITNSGRFSKLPGWTPPVLPGGTKLGDELKDVTGKIFVDSGPEFAVPECGILDMSEVDVILISNYHCMLALPFITEYTNFKGIVYATEPTLHIGKLFMEELVTYVERTPKPGRATKWKQPNIISFLPPPLKDAIHPTKWRQCYSKHDINASLSHIKMINFNESIDIFGSVNVMPVSSGYCLGSANWVIRSDYEKIAYISGSSTLTTHPKPMEQSPLRNTDILIMSRLTQTPTCNPDAMIGEFCINTAMTLRNGGNVLVPCYPSGVTYDLFECLSRHLESCGLLTVPMYFISPVADSSLAYSNIYAEWLSAEKACKVFLPEPPFPHWELIEANRLVHFSNLHSLQPEMKSPCVVFTGHPSLRVGDIVHFLELWGTSSTNTLIITEPDFPYLEALAPYQPLNMKVCYCPIDTSLSFTQANKLIRELKPLHLVISEQYLTPPILQPHNNTLVIECEPPPVTYRRGEVLTLPVKRRFERIEMDPVLAASLLPSEIKPGVAIATLTGELAGKDNKYLLQPLKHDGKPGRKRKRDGSETYPSSYIWGAPNVNEFVLQLDKQGVVDIKVEESASGHIVHLPSEDTLIQIEEGSTHIICEGNEELRIKLRDTLLKCLAKF